MLMAFARNVARKSRRASNANRWAALAQRRSTVKEIIEKEIKWCEEHRGMKSEVYEEAFIAGLKQVLFFISEIEKLESVDNMADGKILEAWSEYFDKNSDMLLSSLKSDVSQMSFYAGVKAAEQNVQLDDGHCNCESKDSEYHNGSVWICTHCRRPRRN
jgi:hypothetical protein